MSQRTSNIRPRSVVIGNLIHGAGALLDWGIQDRSRLSEADFKFLRDDADALFKDWSVVGNDLRLAMGPPLTIHTEGRLLFSPEELLATNDAVGRQQTRQTKAG